MKGTAISLAIVISGASWAGTTKPIAYRSVLSNGVRYHAVVADMRSNRVAVETAASSRFRTASSLVRDNKATAAITGTFFNPASALPVADVLVDGKLVAEGNRGSVLGVTWFGDVRVFDIPYRQTFNWFPYRYALRGTVRIMSGGVVAPNPKAQKFRDSRVWSKAKRTAAGVTKDGNLVFIATNSNVYLRDIGNAMKKLGVVDAVALDGGSSTHLSYRGKSVISAGRSLTNMLILKELSADAGDWAQYPIRRRHAGPATFLVTCPTKYWPLPTATTAKPTSERQASLGNRK
ncbi:MAG: phosphodiester glycosidase family protein [Chthonomonas sp.]|nr:phosphodiester glycosidase family protein [Chthonomonas sp.]